MAVESYKWRKWFYWLTFVSLVLRVLLAANLELGNDEVYYRLYALYPDWSHFDHPLMVGLVIQFFSLDLLLDSELFIRMGSIVLGTANLFLVYSIGERLKNPRTGFFAAVLYTTSIYTFVITGIFILPDTPQQFFWLLSLSLMLSVLPACPNRKRIGLKMMGMGLAIGFAIISKYTSVFLWLGAGIYILLYNRQWLKSKWFYLAVLITTIVSLPILIWNMQNDFISFGFHSQRVDVAGYSINLNYLLTELLGEFFYNSPVNYILIVIALTTALRGKLKIEGNHLKVILLVSLPLIVLFIGFSLFRATLPHWSAPGFTGLIFLAAIWLNEFVQNRDLQPLPWPLQIAAILISIVLLLGFAQVNYGLVKMPASEDYNKLGSNDPSLDMFGYEQVGNEFAKIVEKDILQQKMPDDAILVGNKWFPLANFDYYAASPIGMKVFAIGSLERIHKYKWINRKNGGLQKGMNAYYITDSREYRSPNEFFDKYFERIEVADTIQIYRGEKLVKRAFVYRLHDYK